MSAALGPPPPNLSKGELLLAELKNAGVAGLTRSQLQQRLGWPSNQVKAVTVQLYNKEMLRRRVLAYAKKGCPCVYCECGDQEHYWAWEFAPPFTNGYNVMMCDEKGKRPEKGSIPEPPPALYAPAVSVEAVAPHTQMQREPASPKAAAPAASVKSPAKSPGKSAGTGAQSALCEECNLLVRDCTCAPAETAFAAPGGLASPSRKRAASVEAPKASPARKKASPPPAPLAHKELIVAPRKLAPVAPSIPAPPPARQGVPLTLGSGRPMPPAPAQGSQPKPKTVAPPLAARVAPPAPTLRLWVEMLDEEEGSSRGFFLKPEDLRAMGVREQALHAWVERRRAVRNAAPDHASMAGAGRALPRPTPTPTPLLPRTAAPPPPAIPEEYTAAFYRAMEALMKREDSCPRSLMEERLAGEGLSLADVQRCLDMFAERNVICLTVDAVFKC